MTIISRNHAIVKRHWHCGLIFLLAGIAAVMIFAPLAGVAGDGWTLTETGALLLTLSPIPALCAAAMAMDNGRR